MLSSPSGSWVRPDTVRRRLAYSRLTLSARPPALGSVRPYMWSIFAVVLATLAGLGLTTLVTLPNVSMVFLLAVVFTAARWGIWPALVASGVSFVAYNFFFVEPLYTLTVAQQEQVLALLVFLAIAVL